MPVANVPRRHHYVPRLLLKRFADSSGNLWTYDTELKKFWQNSPASAAFEKNFYSLGMNSPAPDHSKIENFLAEFVDAPGDSSIEQLLQREMLAPEKWFDFIRFVAAQMQRTPSALDRLDLIHTPIFQEMVKRMPNDPNFNIGTKMSSLGVSQKDIDEYIESIRSGDVKVKASRDF